MLITKLVSSKEELEQIAQLSAANQVANISAETKEKEGFVSWIYSTEILTRLHAIIPSVITMDGNQLAGYAISLTKDCADVYPSLATMLEYTGSVTYKGRPLSEQSFYIMGQICVDIDYRGQGVVQQLYEFHKKHFSSQYPLLVTEISVNNPRSLKAHKKVGFEIIDTHRDHEGMWDLVAWDWHTPGT